MYDNGTGKKQRSIRNQLQLKIRLHLNKSRPFASSKSLGLHNSARESCDGNHDRIYINDVQISILRGTYFERWLRFNLTEATQTICLPANLLTASIDVVTSGTMLPLRLPSKIGSQAFFGPNRVNLRSGTV